MLNNLMNSQLSDYPLSTETTISLDVFSAQPVNGGLEMKTMEEPGNQLLHAREGRRWSRAEIASMLRLNVNVITALEENNYSHLPLRTFVRGYIRSYAGLLDLNPEPLLAAYERHNVAILPPVTPFIQRQSSSDRAWHLFSYIVIVGLIVLVAIWWQSDTPPEVENTLITPPLISPVEITKHNTSSVLETPIPDVQSRELAEILAAGPPSEDASTPTPTTKIDQHDATTTPDTNVQIATMTATTSTEHHPESTSATPTAAPPTIKIMTTEDTWIKIQDGKGKQLFNAQIKAGQTQSLQGHPPFKVRLGKTDGGKIDGVTVEYNGQPFDFHRYIKGKIARFTLDK